jgi:plasmid stability protein
MASLTLKNMPEDLHERLKTEAVAHGRSLTKEAFHCLRIALTRGGPDGSEIEAKASRVRKLFRSDLDPADLDRWKRQGRP